VKPILLKVPRFTQPDATTCGPTCLAKVYSYYGYEKDLTDVIAETPRNPDGGTLAVNLGVSALKNGFEPTIYPFGHRIFDPTWRRLTRRRLIRKLEARYAAVESRRLRRAVSAYIAYLNLDGNIRFKEPRKQLFVDVLAGGDPILTGLSATYLYRTAREYEDRYDDVRGESTGHFVVIAGYYPRTDRFVVVDPFENVPMSRRGRYSVSAERLIAAVLLGDVTYDAVALVLGPRPRG
jgi:hypothetical protein